MIKIHTRSKIEQAKPKTVIEHIINTNLEFGFRDSYRLLPEETLNYVESVYGTNASYNLINSEKTVKTNLERSRKFFEGFRNTLEEARRGRPPKNKTANNDTSVNMIAQLHKAVSLGGQHPVVFNDGSVHKVPEDLAMKVLAKHYAMEKPSDKSKYHDHICKSLNNLKEDIGE